MAAQTGTGTIDTSTRRALGRRGLLAGAAAAAAAVVIAKETATPALAAGSLTLDTDNATTGNTNVHGSGNNAPWNAAAPLKPVFSVQNNGGANNDAIAAKAPGYAVYGETTGQFIGVYGNATANGDGVKGASASGAGVRAVSGSGIGLLASSTSGRAITATAGGDVAIFGSAGLYGLWGLSTGNAANAAGVYGSSSTGYGILGQTTAAGFSGCTGIANTPGTAAFAGGATNGAYAAFFTGSVVVDGDFTVLDPTRKHGAIKHPDGTHRTLYSVESPESWLEDFGAARLSGGAAEVRLDADFAAVVETGEYHVFLTPEGECKGLYVANKGAGGFSVRELGGGTAGVAFAWRVVAKPKTEKKAARMAKFAPPNIRMPAASDLPKPPDTAKLLAEPHKS